MKTHLIGTGVLDWYPAERRTDRYGKLCLFTVDGAEKSDTVVLSKKLEGTYGRLVAEVIQSRPSYHIGDLDRGIRPEQPKVGDRIILGKGRLVYGESDPSIYVEADCVGLKPEVAKHNDWLDAHALYRAHNQTVRLVFEELPQKRTCH